MIVNGQKLCEMIRESRISKNISQRELARRVNVNNAVICRIENGKTKKPSFQLLKSLSEELNLDLVQLLSAALYTIEEIHNLGYIELSGFAGVRGSEKIENYLTRNNNDDDIIDLIKIFKSYKNKKIDINETFALICVATGGIDLTRYVPDELKAKYGISTSFMIEKKKK